MRYFQDPVSKQVMGYDPTEPTQLPYMQEKINLGWSDITGRWPPQLSQDQTREICSNSLGSAINDGAMQWGYYSIESAATYLNSSNPQYVADAQALIAWRDTVWEWAIPKLEVIVPGTTPAEFLADMPDLPPQPKV
jgi:hypothetical protein